MKRLQYLPTHLFLALLVLLLPAYSCRPYHMYQGQHRTPDQISIIRQAKTVLLLEIDGGDTGLSNQFRLLPGPHTFVVQIRRISAVGSASTGRPPKEARLPICSCQIQLDTWAGAQYLVDSREHSENVWIAWVGSADKGGKDAADPERLPHCTCTG